MVIPEIIENDIVGVGPEKCEREIYTFFSLLLLFLGRKSWKRKASSTSQSTSFSLISSGSHYVNTIGLSPMCHISHDPSRPSIHPSELWERKKSCEKGPTLRLSCLQCDSILFLYLNRYNRRRSIKRKKFSLTRPLHLSNSRSVSSVASSAQRLIRFRHRSTDRSRGGREEKREKSSKSFYTEHNTITSKFLRGGIIKPDSTP